MQKKLIMIVIYYSRMHSSFPKKMRIFRLQLSNYMQRIVFSNILLSHKFLRPESPDSGHETMVTFKFMKCLMFTVVASFNELRKLIKQLILSN